MKIKEGYIIKSVAGSNVIVPVSDPHFKAVITVNDTGAFLFEKLKSETDIEKLTDSLLEEYEIDRATAQKDVEMFIGALSKAGLIDG